MNGRSLSLCFNVEGLRVTLWPPLTLLPPSCLLWEEDDSSDRPGLLGQPILQAISLDWVENFNSGVEYEEVQCGPESEPAAVCNKSDELICVGLTPRVSHHWWLTQEWKRCIIYPSPAKPPTSDVCTVLFSLQSPSVSIISRAVNEVTKGYGSVGKEWLISVGETTWICLLVSLVQQRCWAGRFLNSAPPKPLQKEGNRQRTSAHFQNWPRPTSSLLFWSTAYLVHLPLIYDFYWLCIGISDSYLRKSWLCQPLWTCYCDMSWHPLWVRTWG